MNESEAALHAEIPIIPSAEDVRSAHRLIKAMTIRTPILVSDDLNRLLGCEAFFKCENLQRTGSFKFRGASHAIAKLPASGRARGVVTQSSGNHGAALAHAAAREGIKAYVVVPEGAAKIKVANIEAAGARVVRCAPTMAARDAATERIVAETGAAIIHPFDHFDVVAGQGTVALEMLDELGKLDAIAAPIGGGGLLSGVSIYAKAQDPAMEIIGAEPSGAADAYRGLQDKRRIVDFVPDTLADGLRAYLGRIGFEALSHRCGRILLVDDAASIEAMRLLWEKLKLVVELSSSVVVAALLAHREAVAGKRVGIVLSGGNVDLGDLPWIASH